MGSSLKMNKGPYYWVFIYLILMTIPGELHLSLGGVRVELYRIFLIFAFVAFIKSQLFFKVDIYLLLYSFFCFLGFFWLHGFSSIQSSAILFLEVVVGYLVGYNLKGSIYRLKRFTTAFCVILILFIPLAIHEALTGYRATHVLAASLTNVYVESYLGDSYFRYGLHRSSVFFAHPILYSICAAMLLPLIFLFYKGFKRYLLSTGIFVALITSVTSAGVLMVVIQIGLYFLKYLQKYVRNIFALVVGLYLFIFGMLFMLSNRGPILIFIQTLSFNQHTAYARYQQWQYASDDVANNIFFGIGFNTWSRPAYMGDSIDSFWLLTILQNGVFAFLCLFFFVCRSMRRYWKAWRTRKDDKFFVFFVVLFSFFFAGFTVDLFDRAQLVFFLMLGVFNSFVDYDNSLMTGNHKKPKEKLVMRENDA